VIFNISAREKGLPEGMEKKLELGDGMLQGRNDFGRIGYGGPCPPPGKPHRYVFTIHALDTPLTLAAGCSKSDLLSAMKGHVLAAASMHGIFGR
jgi:Raf kinase inhibitor-like YbhB/YbcL family protein